VKRIRLILVVMGVIGACAAVVVALALVPAVQTWAARFGLASKPALRGSLGSIAASPGGIALSGLQFEWKGIVCTLPSLRAELPVLAACLRHDIRVNRLVARGWTLDLSRPQAGAAAAAISTSRRRAGIIPEALAADDRVPTAALHVFQGVFARLTLPFDLAVDGLELEGDLILPGPPGEPPERVHVTISGGNLGAAREGIFAVGATARIGAPAAPVMSVDVSGTLSAAMDSPRTFTRVEVKANLSAAGPQLANPVQLTARATAARSADGEAYAVSLGRGLQPIASVVAQFPDSTRRLSGTWKIDMSDSDLAPFALGRPIPVFSASGEGDFGVDATLRSLEAKGKLDARADKVGLLVPALEPLGLVRLNADFDLAIHGDDLRVEHLVASAASAGPLASVRALQPFEFNASTGELKVANPNADLMGISVQALPMALLSRFAGGGALSGQDLHGEFVVRAGGGGLELRPTLPLVSGGASLSIRGRRVLQGLDVSLFLLADYAPQGWQIRMAPLTLGAEGLRILTVDARLGQLAGRAQPIQAAGTWSVVLAAVGAQPFASALPPIGSGEASGDFSVTSDGNTKIETKISTLGVTLRGQPGETAAALPNLSATVRADRDSAGRITFTAPVTLTEGHRISDLTASGTWAPATAGGVATVRLTASRLFGDDAVLFAGLIAGSAGAALPASSSGDGATPVRSAVAPWSGVTGTVTLALKEVALEKWDLREVSGIIRMAPGELRLDGGRASLGDGCQAKIDGGIGFDGAAEKPFSLQTNIVVDNFDSAPLFRALRPGELPTVEGRFDLTGAVTGRSVRIEDLGAEIQGEFHLNSKGGIFRALRADIADSIKQAPSRLSGAIDTVTSLFGKHGDSSDNASKFIDKTGQAAVEFTERLREVHYDQIHVSAIRGSDLTIHMVDISLIAPEQRLTGTGEVTYQPGQPILEQPLSLDLQLSARGKTAELMNTIGLLKDERDDLGYSKMIQPIHLGGTLDRVDDSQWQDLLIQAALKKAGSGLLNRLLGK